MSNKTELVLRKEKLKDIIDLILEDDIVTIENVLYDAIKTDCRTTVITIDWGRRRLREEE